MFQTQMAYAQHDDEVTRVTHTAQQILTETWIKLETKRLHLDEDFSEGRAQVRADLLRRTKDQSVELSIDGSGVGFVDAFFDGMMRAFDKEYSSLPGLSLIDFQVATKGDAGKGRGTDAQALAQIKVRNPEGNDFGFSFRTPSISRSTVGVVEEALAFFINCERAYIQLHLALGDAKARNRSDLVDRYQSQMGVLVRATSYRELAEKLARGT